jgi:N6-L-threonylcarbamoyladenine synthase
VNLAASFQRTVVRALLDRMSDGIERLKPRTLILGGGVACNSELRREAKALASAFGLPLYYPSPVLTTDNAAMIAAAGYPKLLRGERASFDLPAESCLRLETFSGMQTPSRRTARYKL